MRRNRFFRASLAVIATGNPPWFGTRYGLVQDMVPLSPPQVAPAGIEEPPTRGSECGRASPHGPLSKSRAVGRPDSYHGFQPTELHLGCVEGGGKRQVEQGLPLVGAGGDQ